MRKRDRKILYIFGKRFQLSAFENLNRWIVVLLNSNEHQFAAVLPLISFVVLLRFCEQC